ncbi:MAG: RagB/SusD family nutrient uptake outer membrane protein [Bacteroidales bacterium]|nr:RagB/SusD family nutrient uptake outer membrane protein [Bacteroidales bacterium]
MKTIKYISSVLVVCGVLSSCEKMLEMEPKMDLSDKTALTSTAGLQSALIGAYDRIQGGDLYGGRIWVAGDMLADNVKISGEQNTVYEELQMINKTMSADNRITTSFWSNAYFTINLVNNVIKEIPNVSDKDIAANKDRLEGEALFIRALLYFDMVRYLGNPVTGLGVPYLKEPTGITVNPARDNIETCYQNIIADLEKAVTLLPATNSDRATKWAAYALLGRVRFYHGDYAESIIACTEVIDKGGFTLEPLIINNYSAAKSGEVIFAIMSTTADASCGTLNGYYRYKSSGKFSPSNDYIQVLASEKSSGDNRVMQLYENIEGKFFTKKFDDRYMNVPILRLSEMYLTRAECKVMVNAADLTAVDDLNVIRARAGLTNAKKATLSAIYLQRIKELAFEGDHFHNMKRLQKDIAGLPWNDIKLVFKVPQREMDVNPNMVQNE